jgi:hypothetical protein
LEHQFGKAFSTLVSKSEMNDHAAEKGDCPAKKLEANKGSLLVPKAYQNHGHFTNARHTDFIKKNPSKGRILGHLR